MRDVHFTEIRARLLRFDVDYGLGRYVEFLVLLVCGVLKIIFECLIRFDLGCTYVEFRCMHNEAFNIEFFFGRNLF